MYRNLFLNFYTLPLFCYNILKTAAKEVKLITSSSQTRIHVVISVLIGQQISVWVNVCPAFLACGSSLSGNRPCIRVCQTLRFSNNQLNKASGGPHSRGSRVSSWHTSPTRKHLSFRVRNGMMQLLPVVHTPGLYRWRMSLTWKHISSNYLLQATVGGAAIATGEPVPWRRSPTRKQNRPELSIRSSKSCIESLSKGF